MKVYGLTGGIGSGKSTAGEILVQLGAEVIDTDLIGRELTRPGTQELREIAAVFGQEVLSNEGLNRQRLAEIVFVSAKARQRLEEILHPPIRARWQGRVREWREQGNISKVVVIIPLLFETGAEREVDSTICVGCSEETQRNRLLARGWTAQHIEQRLGAQLPVAEKMERADYVIWNEFDFSTCGEQLRRVVGTSA